MHNLTQNNVYNFLYICMLICITSNDKNKKIKKKFKTDALGYWTILIFNGKYAWDIHNWQDNFFSYA